MHFNTGLLATALLATSALAAPRARGSTLAQRLASRGRRTTLPKFIDVPTNGISSENTTHESYSDNWAGAVITSPPSGTTFSGVSAQFVVPTPSVPSGGDDSTQYAASAWVGIDGDTYGNAILQTGLDFFVQGSSVSYAAWYEWFPDGAYDFSGLTINAGDTISISVVASSNSAGTAVIENLSNGGSVQQALNAPSSSSVLAGQNAEWIVEDFEEGGGLVPFADFGTVTFTSATYTTADGGSGDSSSAGLIDIDQGTILTSSSVDGNSVTVSYT